MDSFTSGSVIEPRTTMTNQTKVNNRLPLIVAIIEAIAIIGLIIALVIVIVSKTESSYSEEEGAIEYIDEEPIYALNNKDANVLMYLHAVTNNSVFNDVIIPSSVCGNLQNIFNSFPDEDLAMASDPCQNQQITLFSMDKSDTDLAARGVLHIGVIIDNQDYNYYVYSDFSAIENLSEGNEIPATTLTLNVGS